MSNVSFHRIKLIYYHQIINSEFCYKHLKFIHYHQICKVEFNQPSCWLYSVPNLFIIQQLVTLCLGGNHVRVVCERVWKIAQVCAKKQGLAAGSHGWLAACKPPEDAHEWSMQRNWTVIPTVALQDKKSSLAIQLSRGLDSRLSQVTRPSH